VRDAALRLGLRSQEQADFLMKMPNRNFFIQTPNGGEPKLLTVPEITRDEHNTREIEALAREQTSRIPFTPFDPMELEQKWAANRARVDNSLDKKILTHYHDYPFMSAKDRARNLGIHHEKLVSESSKLKQGGLLKVETVSLGVGRPRISAILTPDGLEYIGKKSLPGKGGLLHKFLVEQVRSTLKDPSSAFIECENCDLVVVTGKEKVAYEVETKPGQQLIDNLVRDLLVSGYAKVIVVVRNQSDQKAAKSKILEGGLPEHLHSKIEVKTIKEILEA